MVDRARISNGASPFSSREAQNYQSAEPVMCIHPLAMMDPGCINLPGPNWCFFKINEESIIFCEMEMTDKTKLPRIVKHVEMDLKNGMCVSYMIDRKISDVPAITRNDVERCIEELHMMNACSGGPLASNYPAAVRANSQVDILGKWRHNSCKIIVPWPGTFCNACETLIYEFPLAGTNKKSNTDKPKRVIISNLSHRKQSQIIALRKRCQTWYRKKRNAEKEMKMIKEMISEISEEPEEEIEGINLDDSDD